MIRLTLAIFFAVTSLICFCSIETIAQTTDSNLNSKLFPTKGHKEVAILKSTNVSADTLKTLLIVPNTTSWIEIGKKINYFKEVMTVAELQRDIIAKGLSDKIPSISDRLGLYNACIHYKHFVLLNMSVEDLKTQGVRTRLSLFDPMRSDIIFKNEVRLNMMWEGYSDKKILYPLLNSLVDYLSEQK